MRPLRNAVMVALLAVAPMMAFERNALAQQGGEDSNDAAALFRQGQEAYANGDQETAYEKYLAAWNLKRSYDIAGNLGNVEVKLKKYKEAVPHLEYVLANLPVSMDSETRAAVTTRTQDLLKEARSHVAEVKFSVTPPDAAVSVDGTPVEGGRVLLDPGSHRLSVTADGYEPDDRTLEVSGGSVETMVVSLRESGPIVPEAGGDDGPSIPIIIAGGVLGVGALGAGIALHVVAAGKGGERQDLIDGIGNDGGCSGGDVHPDCPAIAELADQESTFSGAGTGLLIGGGVVIAATLTYWLWPRGGDDETALMLLPTVGPTQTGLTLTGQF